MQFYGIDAVVRIISHLIFIYISFWALQSIRTEQVFKPYYTGHIRIIILLVAIVIGYNASSFFFEFLALSRNIFSGVFT